MLHIMVGLRAGTMLEYSTLRGRAGRSISDKYKLCVGPGIIPIRLLLGIRSSTTNLVYLRYRLSRNLVFSSIYYTSFPVKDHFISRMMTIDMGVMVHREKRRGASSVPLPKTFDGLFHRVCPISAILLDGSFFKHSVEKIFQHH